MFTQSSVEHTLEMFGPRNIAWRPAGSSHGELLRDAVVLAHHERISEAIEKAQDLWIEKHGHMRNVSFRVTTKKTTVSAMSPKDLADTGPED